MDRSGAEAKARGAATGGEEPFQRDFTQLLASPNICSKHWVYEQYDSMVQTNTMQGPGSLAGVIRIKGTGRGLAMALYGNGRWCYLDPKLGADAQRGAGGADGGLHRRAARGGNQLPELRQSREAADHGGSSRR